MVLGKYGKTPMEMDPAFVKQIIGDEQPITYRPADDLAPELDKLRADLPAGLQTQDEDVLSYALFEKVALKFFEHRKEVTYGLDGNHADAKTGVHTV